MQVHVFQDYNLSQNGLSLEGYRRGTIEISHMFFRDPDSQFWRDLTDLIADLSDHLGGSRPVNVLSVGCGSGEEVYSIAMLAHKFSQKVNVIDLDIFSDNISNARQGVYPVLYYANFLPEFIETIPAAFQRYFEKTDGGWRVNEGIREMVRFVESDVRYASLEEFNPDVIVCRYLFHWLNEEMRRTLTLKFQDAASVVMIDESAQISAEALSEIKFRYFLAKSDGKIP